MLPHGCVCVTMVRWIKHSSKDKKADFIWILFWHHKKKKHLSEYPHWFQFTLHHTLSVSRCVDRACNTPLGNLASGRTLLTLSSCCGNSSFHHTPCPHHRGTPLLCPEDAHPPALMTDDPFSHPHTWWASGADTGGQDEIRLDLETHFYLSHVILLFRTPRPAAMTIERSADFGKTWEVLKLFAQNCSLEFGLLDDNVQSGSLCTSRYSSATSCTRGEVSKHVQ